MKNKMEIVSTLDLVKGMNTDARLWAEAFEDAKQLNGWEEKDIDVELMTGWFATVIETSKDHMRYREESFAHA